MVAPTATYAFGAPGAQGRVELYWADRYKTYLNNREFTTVSDHDDRELGSAFYWRVGPKTYALVEGRWTDIDYRSSASNQSSKEERYFAGVTWEATALTTGTVKFGRLTKKFDTNFFPDTKDTNWEALVTWAPLTYSRFDFYTTRTTTESTGLGAYILSDIYGANWNHGWTSYLSSAVLMRYQRDAYRGVDRTDDTWTAGVKVGYKFRRWLTLGAEYNYTKRDSNVPQFEYDKSLYMLTATASM